MKHAFSLVELSIVLVILGLLTGGILTGQSLIRAAELRAVTTELQSYQTAVMTFRDKYFAIPGDMRNAESFWGTMATGTCPNATAGTGTQTCNGSGDGIINIAAAASQTGEQFLFWQHLANAGLIEGTYTGIAGGSGFSHIILGENAPRSKISNAGFAVRYASTQAGGAGASWFAGEYGNYFDYGANTTSGYPHGVVLSPEELWNIDTKIDDGKPGYGKVRTYTNTYRANCATTDLKDTAEYSLTTNSNTCIVIFIGGF